MDGVGCIWSQWGVYPTCFASESTLGPWGQVMDFLRKLVPLYNVPCIQSVTLDVGTQHGFNAVGHKSVVVL